MKLIVDNQLPLQLAIHLRGWGLDCVHVLEMGLNEAVDRTMWDRAVAAKAALISKDEDFTLPLKRPEETGRLIWVRIGNCRNAALLASFDRTRLALMRALADGQQLIELR